MLACQKNFTLSQLSAKLSESMLASIGPILAAYLFGSLPFMVALGKARGLDLSQEKDLHSALWRKVGIREGLAGLFVDYGKGVIPVLIGFGFNLPLLVVGLCGVAAVAGQMWPVFRNFDGEKGNTTGMAMAITLLVVYSVQHPTLVFLIPMGIGGLMKFFFVRFRFKGSFSERMKLPESTHPLALCFPVGMIVGFAIAPLLSWSLRWPTEITLCLLALFAIILVRRLTADLRGDLKTARSVTRVLTNRLLFDRSYL